MVAVVLPLPKNQQIFGDPDRLHAKLVRLILSKCGGNNTKCQLAYKSFFYNDNTDKLRIAFGVQVAKNDSVIRATAPSGCSPVRLVPAVGVTTGAHYRMSTDILHPHKLQICGGPERSNRTAKPIVRPKGDKNFLPRLKV